MSPGCPKATFTEQVPGLASRYSRRTPPFTAMLAAVAAAACGRAGVRLAAALGAAGPARQSESVRNFVRGGDRKQCFRRSQGVTWRGGG